MVHLAGNHAAPSKFHAYSYPHAAPGFAESDLEEYDKVSAGLAWSRSLELVRKAFEVEVDLESIWEEHSRRESLSRTPRCFLRDQTCPASPCRIFDSRMFTCPFCGFEKTVASDE